MVDQAMESGEVRIVPLLPKTTSLVPVQMMDLRYVVVPELWVVQMRPSGEVTTIPLAPTATSWVPVHVIEEK